MRRGENIYSMMGGRVEEMCDMDRKIGELKKRRFFARRKFRDRGKGKRSGEWIGREGGVSRGLVAGKLLKGAIAYRWGEGGSYGFQYKTGFGQQLALRLERCQ